MNTIETNPKQTTKNNNMAWVSWISVAGLVAGTVNKLRTKGQKKIPLYLNTKNYFVFQHLFTHNM